MCYLKPLKLETLQLKLFEMFDVSFKDKKVSINPEFSNHCNVWFFLTSLILLNIVSIKVCFYQSLI